MGAIANTSEPSSPEQGVYPPLEEAAWLYQANQVRPEDLPRFAAGEAGLAELASDEWLEIEVEAAEEQAFVALLPPCACCIEYTLGLDEVAWEAQLRIAARALVSHPTVGPDV